MSNTVAIERENGTDAMTISGLVELSQEVGKHGADIQKLKEETGKLDRLEKDVNAVVNEVITIRQEFGAETRLIRQEIKQLNENDEKIEAGIIEISKGNITFRYYLAGGIASATVLIFGCMVWTLMFGLDLTNKSQTTMQASIEKTIKAQDKKHTEKIDKISTQIGELRNFITEVKRPK